MNLAARLFVTDVYRTPPLRGDTDVEREINYEADIRAARRDRFTAVLSEFCERGNRDLPPFANETAIRAAQALIDEMIAEGALDRRHRAEMLRSVHFEQDGKVTVAIVCRFGFPLDVTPV